MLDPHPAKAVMHSGQREAHVCPGVECRYFSATLAEINAGKTIVPREALLRGAPLDFLLRVTGNFGAATDVRLSTTAPSPVDIVTIPLASLRDGAIIRPGAIGGSISPLRSVSAAFAFDDMADGGGASGTFAFPAGALPAGAKVLWWEANTTTGFTGNVSAVIQVGVSGDADRFSADTAQSVFAPGRVGSAPLAADVLDGLAAAVTPLVTITGNSDFTAIDAGATVVTIYYLDPAQDDDTAAQLGAGFLALGAIGEGIQIRKTGSAATGGTGVSGWIMYQLTNI